MEKDSTERAERQEICPESVQAFVVELWCQFSYLYLHNFMQDWHLDHKWKYQTSYNWK